MALSTQDLGEIRAQWEEWVPDGFRLDIEVKGAGVMAEVVDSYEVMARLTSQLYCQVEVWTTLRDDRPRRCLFSERVPHDAGALRASVTVLARTIAERQADDGQQP